MHVRIILVEPRDAGNVGAAARAMKNFGFTDLWIAGGGEERTDDVSSWWAVGANDVVRSATRVATLADALVDCHLTIATTAVRRRHVFEQLTPHDVARLAEETLGDEHRLALVFGRERWGLTSAEIAMCQRTASIPTWPEFPTMNLAQSGAILFDEIGYFGDKSPERICAELQALAGRAGLTTREASLLLSLLRRIERR